MRHTYLLKGCVVICGCIVACVGGRKPARADMCAYVDTLTFEWTVPETGDAALYRIFISKNRGPFTPSGADTPHPYYSFKVDESCYSSPCTYQLYAQSLDENHQGSDESRSDPSEIVHVCLNGLSDSGTGYNCADADQDRMPTEWEFRFGLDPFGSPQDGTRDTDSDGVSDLEEYWRNRNPLDPSDAVWDIHGSRPPIASAGKDFYAQVGSVVLLDGAGSYAPDGDLLSYEWTQVGGHEVDLIDGTSSSPWFVAQETGTYVFQLVTRDGQIESTPATVAVRVVPALPQPGDVTSRASLDVPDGVLDSYDIVRALQYFLGMPRPTKEKLKIVDVVPFKVLSVSGTSMDIVFKPDGVFDELDIVALVMLAKYTGYYSIVGWECAYQICF